MLKTAPEGAGRYDRLHGDEDLTDIADEKLYEMAEEMLQDPNELRQTLEDEFLADAIATTMLNLERADRGELPALSALVGAWIKVRPALVDMLRDRAYDKVTA